MMTPKIQRMRSPKEKMFIALTVAVTSLFFICISIFLLCRGKMIGWVFLMFFLWIGLLNIRSFIRNFKNKDAV